MEKRFISPHTTRSPPPLSPAPSVFRRLSLSSPPPLSPLSAPRRRASISAARPAGAARPLGRPDTSPLRQAAHESAAAGPPQLESPSGREHRCHRYPSEQIRRRVFLRRRHQVGLATASVTASSSSCPAAARCCLGRAFAGDDYPPGPTLVRPISDWRRRSAMAIPLVLVVLPLGLLFLLSGLIVNTIQAILFVTIRPFSKSFYRRINRFLAELLWLQLVWLVDWWAGVKVQLHADDETYQSMGKEHALVISNHRSDIDWLIGWILAQRCGCLGSTLAVMKKSSKFLPVIGWSMWFAEYLFLERSWAKDEKTLKWGLQRLKDFPRPFWLALFVEGTRFTPAKLLAAQEYAASQGLPAPRNVLIPRTKGFVSAVSIMRDFVPAIYDTTVIVPKDSPQPTMLRILKGQPSVIHVRMKRHAMSEMPKSDEDVSKWCKDIFVAKDALLDKHLATGTFDEEIRPIGRPVKSLLVTLFWSCLLSFGAIEFFKWTQLLSTWRGVAFTAVGMSLVTGVMHVFIMFSQAERSSSAKAARNRVKKD